MRNEIEDEAGYDGIEGAIRERHRLGVSQLEIRARAACVPARMGDKAV